MTGTTGTPTLPRLPDDRVTELVDRVRPRLGRPVDVMQVAATLESGGVTDRSAREHYHRDDVFDLAEEVFHRLAREPVRPAPPRPARTGAGRVQGLRDVSHGLLYLLPAALLPAVVSVVGRSSVVLALLTAGALGWVWSAGAAWLGYRLLGRGLAGCAARVMRWAVLLGPVLAAAATAAVAGGFPDGPGQVATAAVLLAYQMAVTVALFHRGEGLVLAVMAPAAAAGGLHVVTGRPGAVVVVGVAVGCVALAFALTLRRTTRPHPAAADRSPGGASVEPPLHRAAWPELARLCAVLLYAALSAAYLLHADARHLSGPLDLAVAAAPLVVGMGVVEWRARRFHERARRLLHRTSHPRRFAAGVWLRLYGELLTVTAVVGVLAVPLLAVLRQAGLLSPAGTVLVGAHVVVAGAYFLAFIVAGQGRFGRLGTALGLALAAHLAALLLLPGASAPVTDAAVFLGSAVLLQAMLLTALVGVLGQAWRYR